MKQLLAVLALIAVLAGISYAGREVAVNIAFLVDSGYLKVQKAYGMVYSDITNNAAPGVGGITQTATTNPAALNVGSVTVPGWVFLRNVATNAALQFGMTNTSGGFVPVIELNTGDVAVVRLALPKDNLFIALPSSAGSKVGQVEYNLVDK